MEPGRVTRNLTFPPGNFFPQDYELEAEKLRSILDLENGRNGYISKKPRLQSPAAKVKEEVSKQCPTEAKAAHSLWDQQGLCKQAFHGQQPQPQSGLQGRAEEQGRMAIILKPPILGA